MSVFSGGLEVYGNKTRTKEQMATRETNSAICGWQDTTTGEPCQNPVSDPDHHCYLHGPDGDVPDGHGAPEGNLGGKPGRSGPPGNSNAEGNPGNPDAVPPDGNANAMKHGLHMTAERLLEVMDDQQREAVKETFLEYRDKCMNDKQALKIAVLDVMETDLMRKLIDGDQGTTIYTDEGQPVDVFADKMVQALQGYRREIRLGLHYEGNSAQHTGGGSGGHDNLDALIQDSHENQT